MLTKVFLAPYPLRSSMLAGFFAALAAGAPAYAQTEQDIAGRRELIDNATAARTAGRHAEALDLFNRAGQIQMTPSVRAFIAEEEMQVGQLAEALGATDLCLRELDRDTAVHNHDAIRLHCQTLQSDLRPRVGRLVVQTPSPLPDAFRITVGGRELNPALFNMPSIVTPGDIEIVATAGHGDLAQTRRVTVHVDAGHTESTQIVLPQVVQALVVTPSTPAPLPVAVPAPIPVAPAPVPEAHHNTGTMRTLAWGSAIVGGAALVGGAVALGLQHSYASQFNGPSGMGQYTPAMCQPMSPCATTQSQASTAGAFVWVGFIAGGVLAGMSAFLFATTPSETPAQRAGLSCGEGPGLVGVSCTARF